MQDGVKSLSAHLTDLFVGKKYKTGLSVGCILVDTRPIASQIAVHVPSFFPAHFHFF